MISRIPIFSIISVLLITEIAVRIAVGLELHPDEEGICPEGQNPECQTEEDCLTKIAEGALHENCSKCICWHVPHCDIKR